MPDFKARLHLICSVRAPTGVRKALKAGRPRSIRKFFVDNPPATHARWLLGPDTRIC